MLTKFSQNKLEYITIYNSPYTFIFTESHFFANTRRHNTGTTKTQYRDNNILLVNECLLIGLLESCTGIVQ